MEKIQNLIIGCGLSGVVLARKIAEEKNEKVLIIDRRDHIGGNVYDYKDKNTNITVHKYGPHVFHTNIKEVWDFLSRFTKWHYFHLKPKVFVDGIYATLPFNLNTLYEVFTDYLAKKIEEKLIKNYGYNIKIPILELINSKDEDIKFLSDYVYKNIFENYTFKQWGAKPENIDSSISARVPIYISKDDRYFQDTYQALPRDGYTKMIQNILDHPLIEVRLNTDFKYIQKKISYEKLFYTGAIDEFFDYKFGTLSYRSLRFDIVCEHSEYYQQSAMVNYPNNYDFTRITEHKHFLNEKSNKTILSYEYPCEFINGINERYYPIPGSNSEKLYNKYLQEAVKIKNIYFLGRLGDYKYYNMDKAIERVLHFFNSVIK
ncbi:UDP-galactopyranose mutase [Campylobacter volucris]|uniref:UDP-galactopyranose mutase n=1 Tax=Campylobacter volucris TaxID=1031542 RepID=UPI00105A0BA9|nr:UDP-galactopyranose mutase [Campylobacter volucris]TDJ82085.1 UDP-galactopyranose mutase [Campylobacter volucris]